jgi:hypothetical protein
MNEASNFLVLSIKLFEYYKSLADKSMALLNDEQIHWSPNGQANSIAIIVHHISGNMLSRFTDFLTSDGEKPWRNRDREFEDAYASKTAMLVDWEKGWACLFENIKALVPSDCLSTVYIRNEGHTVMEAIGRQLAHYAYHIGQIVQIVKSMEGVLWSSLTIPKGGSQQFNDTKFSSAPTTQFFTDGMKE